MTDISTLSSFVVVAFCGCWAGLGWTGLGCIYDGLKLSLVGRKEASKQGLDVDLMVVHVHMGSSGLSVFISGVYCLTSRHVPPYPICHLHSKLSLSIYILLIQSHIFLRRPRFPSRNYYSGSSCNLPCEIRRHPHLTPILIRNQWEIKEGG